MTPYDACEIAADLLRQAGFELRYVSRKSEARYFGFPGRYGLLRLAAHPKSKADSFMEPVVARQTFRYCSVREEMAQAMNVSREKVVSMTEAAIGHYMVRSENACSMDASTAPPDSHAETEDPEENIRNI